MLVSLNEIKKYVEINIPTDELITLIGARLVEIEGYIDLSKKYAGIKVAKVTECEAIEGTHLHRCIINDDVQVVCGAPNVHKGMLTAWIMPGSIVPQTYGNEDFKLDVRKLRGFESHGMLAALDELDLGSDHEGIIEIDPKMAKPGDDFAEVFGLNDIILDIENKSLTHRPDCFGLIGFAREVAGILGTQFKEPDFFTINDINFVTKSNIDIEIKDTKLCPRYSCAVLDCSKLPERSKYLTLGAIFLAKAGMRTIDPIVDLTNIMMLETGQPLHAFDYDKFVAVGNSKTPKVIVRAANNDEELTLLDGKTIKCTTDDILITSNNIPVALAGAMGGANTEIDANTKTIILESATFSLYNLRKTQMAHGIFSEAITRFAKGQPADLTMPVLSETIRRLNVSPITIADKYPAKVKPEVIEITADEINNLLGTKYDINLIMTTLKNVNFDVEKCGSNALKITTPFWRTDIHIKEDIIEEVARLLGYDNIELDFPKRLFVSAELNQLHTLMTKIRNILSDQLDCNEVLTYSFVSKELLSKVCQKPEDSYEIVNSISPELQCFRQSIVPSLIDKIRENEKAGYKDFSLYELNQISNKKAGLNDENVPITRNHLGLTTTGDYYHVKNIIETLFRGLKLPIEIKPFDSDLPYFEPLHSASIYFNNSRIGAFGEIRQNVLSKFKIKHAISAIELDIEPIMDSKTDSCVTIKLSRFPYVERDITLKVSDKTNYVDVENTIASVMNMENIIYKINPVSIYQADKKDQTKNISFHIKFANKKKTLTPEEISAIMNVITKATIKMGAEII